MIIRSTWDYHQHQAIFLEKLEKIQNSGTLLQNSLELVRCNLRKTYLDQLNQNNIQIVPSRFHKVDFSQLYVRQSFEDFRTEEIIIKPILGANADHTYRIRRSDLADRMDHLHEVFSDQHFMIQPYLKEIEQEGEFSIFFFSGVYSHAILKTPIRGDFRVQEEHGGIIKSITPEDGMLQIGQKIVRLLSDVPLYARIDLVRVEGSGLLVMEVELIEPSLYLRMDDEAPGRFARAIIKSIG